MTSNELGDNGNLISSAVSKPTPRRWESAVGRRQRCTGESLLISTGFPNDWTVQFIASSLGAISVTAICMEAPSVLSGEMLSNTSGDNGSGPPLTKVKAASTSASSGSAPSKLYKYWRTADFGIGRSSVVTAALYRKFV
jgi:hypothetical protein